MIDSQGNFVADLCEACHKKRATQADTNLNMWLCDDCYSKFDTINLDDEELESLEHKLFLADFGRPL